jgi:hypothetical protein
MGFYGQVHSFQGHNEWLLQSSRSLGLTITGKTPGSGVFLFLAMIPHSQRIQSVLSEGRGS